MGKKRKYLGESSSLLQRVVKTEYVIRTNNELALVARAGAREVVGKPPTTQKT